MDEGYTVEDRRRAKFEDLTEIDGIEMDEPLEKVVHERSPSCPK